MRAGPGRARHDKERGVRFADAVPRWRDRWELRRQFRAVARAVQAEDTQKVTRSLRRLVSHHVAVAFVGRGRSGDRTLDFTDGTHVELDVHDGQAALRQVAKWPARHATYLADVEPCFGYCWYWLHFFAAGHEDMAVLARVDDFESKDAYFRRPDGHERPGHPDAG
jgi:hypothetical protein